MKNEDVMLKYEFHKNIPYDIEYGVLYISKEYETAIHLCACGCGYKTITPLGSDGWALSESNKGITLRPSIGNFKGESPYHAHYYITNSKIVWC